ncbi:MAG: shikimate dehydrogenase [Solirubrobacterales bacterium]
MVGHPISHSRSPAMHAAALADVGLGDWSYRAIDLAPEAFEMGIRGLARDHLGVNVTVPHKPAALAVADGASGAATAIGAANTLSFVDGAIHAENTDAPGLLAALPREVAGARVLVLGAGGAGRAAVWALHGAGARVEVWNRSPERAEQLASEMGVAAVRADPQGTVDTRAVDVIVNTTTVGMKGTGQTFKSLPLAVDHLGSAQTVVDLAYRDSDTDLLLAARRQGSAVVDGLEVLVQQGAIAFEIWTGHEAPIATMRLAARAPHTHTPSRTA